MLPVWWWGWWWCVCCQCEIISASHHLRIFNISPGSQHYNICFLPPRERERERERERIIFCRVHFSTPWLWLPGLETTPWAGWVRGWQSRWSPRTSLSTSEAREWPLTPWGSPGALPSGRPDQLSGHSKQSPNWADCNLKSFNYGVHYNNCWVIL